MCASETVVFRLVVKEIQTHAICNLNVCLGEVIGGGLKTYIYINTNELNTYT